MVTRLDKTIKENKMAEQVTNKEYFGLGKVPRGIGAVLNGWHGQASSVLDFRAMTGACPHDCFHCFTDKRRKTLTLEEIKGVIDQASELGFKGIDYLGEGEPTLDKDFFRIVEYTASRGIVPIIFTDAATKLTNRGFVREIYEFGASVCPKCDSLFDRDYQNWVVGDKTGKYFERRNEALYNLIRKGFNKSREDKRTRLGLDMVVTKRNVEEVGRTLEYCRKSNIFVVFSTYLPAGRSGRENFDKSLVLSQEELSNLRETVRRVDAQYGLSHPIYNNFATFPCVEFIQVYGDGRVSPCPGNEIVIGNIKTDSISSLAGRILRDFPCHRIEHYDGNCHYRR